MMDEAYGTSQGMDTHVSSPAVQQPPVSTQETPKQADERVFRQSEVNDIVRKAKYGAVEDFKRLQSEQPEYVQSKNGNASNQAQQPTPAENRNLPDESTYRKIAAEEAQRLRDQWMQDARTKHETDYAQRIVQNFSQKLTAGKGKYEDFDKVTGGIQLERYPFVVHLLSEHIDNVSDVLYHLSKDESKMAQLERDAEDPRFQHIAISNAKKLAQSLKDNEDASKIRTPNEPLNQMRPSNTGTDNGVMSVSDYRRKYIV